MIIRELRAADLPGVVGLSSELGYECTLAELTERFRQLSGEVRESLLCAVNEQDAPLGFIHLSLGLSFVAPPAVRVAALVVARHCRGQGIGRLLMEHAERWAMHRQIRFVSLTSNEKRSDAHAFYERLGYSNLKSSFRFQKQVGCIGKPERE
jgi:GNAT superfamily N-acetyltransferase